MKNLLISCHNGNIAGRSSGFRLGQWVRFQPKSSRGRKRIDCTLLPPRAFLSAAMNLTVMRPAQRHREFIAHLATECTGLHKTQMMRIRRTPTSNQAGFFDDMSLQTKFSDEMRAFVHLFVEMARRLAVTFRRDHWGFARRQERFDDAFIGVEGLIGQQDIGFHRGSSASAPSRSCA